MVIETGLPGQQICVEVIHRVFAVTTGAAANAVRLA
jgi:hypothetical protein